MGIRFVSVLVHQPLTVMNYASDLSDSQYAICLKIVPLDRKRKYSLRAIFNAIFYVLRTGCQWRLLPHDFPPYLIVHYYFRKWTKDGTFQHLHDKLAEMIRVKLGKNPEPTAAIMDAQSVKTTAESSHHSGYDAGKKTKGRKRHVLVDTLGLLICCLVHSAGMQDRDGAKLLLCKARDRWFRMIWADSGYWSNKLIQWVADRLHRLLSIVKRTSATFVVEHKRWIVERTFAWICQDRRNSKDYERITTSSESFIYLSMVRVMLKHYEA